MVNWIELPDLAAVALLAGAFASVARRGHTAVSRLWLTGWLVGRLSGNQKKRREKRKRKEKSRELKKKKKKSCLI